VIFGRPTRAAPKSQLRQSAQAKIASGELPSPNNLGGAGRSGSGEACCVCGTKIAKYTVAKPTVEYEVQWQEGRRTRLLRFHSRCFRAWVSLAVEPSRGR
jgi:hypothetical protein